MRTDAAATVEDDIDGAIQLGVDAITERLAELGLSLSIERDFAQLKAMFEDQGGFANPTFDPDAVDLGGDDFWILVRAADGTPAGWTAERIFVDVELADLIRSGQIWRREGFGDAGPAIPLERPYGRCFSHSGSTFVCQLWRGQGLSMLLTYLSRGLGFRNSAAEVNTGFVREGLKRSSVPSVSYGYPHLALCWDGYFPPLGIVDRLHLCWIDRQEFAMSCLRLPDHERYPVPLPRSGEVLVPDEPLSERQRDRLSIP